MNHAYSPIGRASTHKNSSTHLSGHAPGPATRELNLIRDALDKDAWNNFIRFYGTPVYAFLLDVGLAAEDAKEVTYDVFFKFSQCIPLFSSPRDHAQPWICRLSLVIWNSIRDDCEPRQYGVVILRVTPLEFANVFRVHIAFANVCDRLDPHHAELQSRIFKSRCFKKMSIEDIAHTENMRIAEVIKIYLYVLTLFEEEIRKLL